MDQEQKWTIGKTLLALFIVIDLIIIGVWLFIYRKNYQDVAMIVGGIWAAVVTLLAFFGIRGEKITTLSELFNLRPVKYIGVTLTTLIFIFSPLFILWEFKVHTLEITTGKEPASIQVLDDTGQEVNKSKYPIKESEPFIVLLQKGSYVIVATPKDTEYEIDTAPVNIEWHHLKKKRIPFNEFQLKQLKPGSLEITTHPELVHLTVRNIDNETEPEFSGHINREKLIPNLAPGKYLINIKANTSGFEEYSQEVSIAAGHPLELNVRLKQKMGTLTLNPSETDMDIFINGKHFGKTPRSVQLEPRNDYNLVLMKQGEHESLAFHFEQKKVPVKANSVTEIHPTITKQEELGVVILKPISQESGTNYTLSDPILKNRNLGSAQFGKKIHVFPGKITIKKYLNDQLITEQTYDINLGQDLEVRL